MKKKGNRYSIIGRTSYYQANGSAAWKRLKSATINGSAPCSIKVLYENMTLREAQQELLSLFNKMPLNINAQTWSYVVYNAKHHDGYDAQSNPDGTRIFDYDGYVFSIVPADSYEVVERLEREMEEV